MVMCSLDEEFLFTDEPLDLALSITSNKWTSNKPKTAVSINVLKPIYMFLVRYIFPLKVIFIEKFMVLQWMEKRSNMKKG